jgi:hypothetical protein
MNKKYTLLSGFSLLLFVFALPSLSLAQAFKRGSFVLSVTEGSTQSTYATGDISPNPSAESPGNQLSETGQRDPLIIEYGISNRWGIGSSWGNDIYSVNPNTFYGFSNSGTNVKAKTSEYTIDGSFHFLVTRRADFALVASAGTFSVAMKGGNSDYSYSYNSNGALVRMGVRTRYYFWRRLGVTSMGTLFSGSASPKGVNDVTVGKTTATHIKGSSVEFGLCYRIFR